jgi:2-polyprenyl-6-methoxyphenol hydroxylase-like FAD-dependent oxidoreductase
VRRGPLLLVFAFELASCGAESGTKRIGSRKTGGRAIAVVPLRGSLRSDDRSFVAAFVTCGKNMSKKPMRRAIIAGGSLGGLFAGCMIRQRGWDVVIVERTKGRLAGRGAGLGVHPSMLEGLLRAGAKVDATVGVAIGGRAVLARDGEIAAEIVMPQLCTSWARLHTLLSNVFPEDCVRRGVAVTAFEQDSGGVTAYLSNGETLKGDVLIGADGVRSTVRRQLLPKTELAYAGYVAWRGMVDERALSPTTHATLFQRFAWGLASDGHIVGYPVPGPDDDVTPGRRCYNFVWYRRVETDPALREMQTDAAGGHHPHGIPPQAIRGHFISDLSRDAGAVFCDAWAEVVRKVDQPLFQPIGDLASSQMCFDRVALLGDAAYVARPHVARGAIKAGDDAIALAEALADFPAEDALRKYDAVRRADNAAIVAESRSLGSYIEGKGERTADPVQFMRENGGVEPSLVDGGLFFRLLREAGFGGPASCPGSALPQQ